MVRGKAVVAVAQRRWFGRCDATAAAALAAAALVAAALAAAFVVVVMFPFIGEKWGQLTWLISLVDPSFSFRSPRRLGRTCRLLSEKSFP